MVCGGLWRRVPASVGRCRWGSHHLGQSGGTTYSRGRTHWHAVDAPDPDRMQKAGRPEMGCPASVGGSSTENYGAGATIPRAAIWSVLRGVIQNSSTWIVSAPAFRKDQVVPPSSVVTKSNLSDVR